MKTLGLHGHFLRTMLPALFAMTFFSASAQEPKLLADTSEVHLTVRDTTGMPIRNARVEMLILSRGRDQGSMEVKTDDSGTIEQDIIPIGDVVRMQISAPGFQAYGVNYPVNSLVKDIVVRLKEQPVIQTAMNEQPPDPAKSSQVTYVYKEPQWVGKKAHRTARKSHASAKSAKAAVPSKNELAVSKPSAIQK
jgi:hypothetical protein